MNRRSIPAICLFAISICTILLISPTIAQSGHNATHKTQLPPLSPPQFFRFVLITGAVQKASHQNTEGDYGVGSSIQPGWEGGADYLHIISGTFYYGLGVHLAVPGRSTLFRMLALPNNPSAHYERNPPEKDRQFDVDLALPLLVEKQWWRAQRKAFYVSAGAQLNIAMNHEFNELSVNLEDSNQKIVQVFHQFVLTYNNDKPWLSCKLGGGMQWILKNGNLLGVGLASNLSCTNFVKGTYEVTLPGKPDTRGVFKANGSYIGVNLSYGLTGKFMRKIRDGG